MKVYNVVNTEGDAAVDAALNDLGLWPERERAVRVTCGDCGAWWYGSAYDDGLCGPCREDNDVLMREHEPEAVVLVNRVAYLFPHMTAGQQLSMAANILRSTLVQ